MSGTHCGSSKPKGLPKARCSGTMRRPLGERTSFLASRRAATPEDMSPPEPLTPPPALSPHRVPPHPAHQHDDSSEAQSSATARNMSQSESSIRPRAALLQSAQGPRPYGQPPIGGEDRGWYPRPSREIVTSDWPINQPRSRLFAPSGRSKLGLESFIGRED